MIIVCGKPTEGQEYPDRYRPGSGDRIFDEIWAYLDRITPGVIPLDVRCYIAGVWRGHISRLLEETAHDLERSDVAIGGQKKSGGGV